MTISEAKRELVALFQSTKIDSPETNAEWLLVTLLGCERSELELRKDVKLTPHQLDLLNSQAKRRANREPLQHILGTACFCGNEFEVSPDVLIPRPETEQLIDHACAALREIPCPVVYDMGTGSGCIAITLAKRLPKARIIASDISLEALRLAKINAEKNGVTGRVDFRQVEGLALAKREQVNLIVSNPPYIPSAEISELQPEVRDYDPHLALDGGDDGLDFYRLLAKLGQAALLPAGILIAEFGDGQEGEIERIFRESAWPKVRFENDLCNKPRIVIASTFQ